MDGNSEECARLVVGIGAVWLRTSCSAAKRRTWGFAYVLPGCAGSRRGALPGLPPCGRDRADGISDLQGDAGVCRADCRCGAKRADAAVVCGKRLRPFFECSIANGGTDRVVD